MAGVVFLTTKRPGNYIDIAIKTIEEQIPIHLFVDGIDTSYLSKHLTDKRISITTIPNKGDDKVLNQFLGYKQCLKCGYIEGERGVLIFEDDIRFARGWKNRLDIVISDLESKYGDRFILSLITHISLCKLNSLPPSYYLPLPIESFRGTMGMYYPNVIRKGILNYFENYDTTRMKCYDVIMGEYLMKNNIPLFAIIPCLIQHIGVKSVWYPTQYTFSAIIFQPILS